MHSWLPPCPLSPTPTTGHTLCLVQTAAPRSRAFLCTTALPPHCPHPAFGTCLPWSPAPRAGTCVSPPSWTTAQARCSVSVRDLPEELLRSAPGRESGQGMELQHAEPQSVAGPCPALVTNSHCCALCGCGAETQEKPALAPNHAAGNRVGSEFEPRSLMPGLARASRDFSPNQASVMLEGPSSGRNRRGWPQRDGVQGSGGGSPHPTHHAQTGLQSALAAQGIIVLSTISSCWRGCWAWLGGAAPQWRKGQGWGEEEASKPGPRTHGLPGGWPQPQGLDPRGIQLAGPYLPQTDIDCFIENLSATRPTGPALGSPVLSAGKEGEREAEL